MHQSWTSQKFLWWFHFPLQYIPLANIWKLIWGQLQKFDIGQSCHRSYSHIKEKLDTRNVFEKQKIQNCNKRNVIFLNCIHEFQSGSACLLKVIWRKITKRVLIIESSKSNDLHLWHLILLMALRINATIMFNTAITNG